MISEEIVKLENVTKKLGRRLTLQDINFEVKEGEKVCILGPKNSGKTSLVEIILGILKPDKGSVSVLGTDPYTNSFPFLKQVSVYYEKNSFPLHWKVKQIINFKKQLWGKEDNQYIFEALNISNIKNTTVGKLSEEERVKLNLFFTFTQKAKLIVLDNPWSNSINFDLENIIKNFSHTSFIITSKSPEPIYNIADKIYILRDGKIEKVAAKQNYPSLEKLKSLYNQYVPED
jgi:ABC-2 type transport system ATP-binding protein